MRFPLENTHSTWVCRVLGGGDAGIEPGRACRGGRGQGAREREGGREERPVSKFLFFFFFAGGMYLGGKSGASQGVWSAAEMDHAILLVRCDAHEPWGVNEKRRQPAI